MGRHKPRPLSIRCGKGFGTDDWSQCTSCGCCGYFGQCVPDKYCLKYVNDRDHGFQLLCKQCIELVELPLQALQSYVCTIVPRATRLSAMCMTVIKLIVKVVIVIVAVVVIVVVFITIVVMHRRHRRVHRQTDKSRAGRLTGGMGMSDRSDGATEAIFFRGHTTIDRSSCQ